MASSYAKIRQAGGTVHHVDYNDSVALMKDGHIDVFLAVTSMPQASFIDLNFKPGIKSHRHRSGQNEGHHRG